MGERPEEKDKTSSFDTRVAGELDKGSFVIGGPTEGPITKGNPLEQVKVEVESARSRDSDPLSGQRLSKRQRDHAKEYFERFRKGK